ncbi:MAG: M23 family metallopeptidase [Candidatus Puniceispirillaceae bacterium]
MIDVGQKIATVGQTGKVDSPQLHFEIRQSRKPIDPRTLIA